MEAQRESTQYISNETFNKFFGNDKKAMIDNIMNSKDHSMVIPTISMKGINPSNISLLPMGNNQQILNLNNPSQHYYQNNLTQAVGNLNNNPRIHDAQIKHPFRDMMN